MTTTLRRLQLYFGAPKQYGFGGSAMSYVIAWKIYSSIFSWLFVSATTLPKCVSG